MKRLVKAICRLPIRVGISSNASATTNLKSRRTIVLHSRASEINASVNIELSWVINLDISIAILSTVRNLHYLRHFAWYEEASLSVCGDRISYFVSPEPMYSSNVLESGNQSDDDHFIPPLTWYLTWHLTSNFAFATRIIAE